MKFQKLTIHNIASIEDAVIDFNAYPLSNSEVFLISGKTGAGKSTILDAICLALYADTPRLDGTEMQGEFNDGKTAVKINDPRQLMRRNTGEAFVCLSFIGSNNVSYEATWSVARARKKPDGNIQQKYWELKNTDKGDILTKDKDIEKEIKSAIGLDFDQFCRTAMLAQGEFTRFLNSKDNEKAELLEKITGVDIYSKIGAKVFQITGEKEQIWKNARQLVEGTSTLSSEQMETRKIELAELEKAADELKKTTDQYAKKLNWIDKDTELIKKEAAASTELNDALTFISSDDFKHRVQRVEQWNSSLEARGCLAEVKKAKVAIDDQNKVIERLSKDFAVLLGGQQRSKSHAANIEARIKV